MHRGTAPSCSDNMEHTYADRDYLQKRWANHLQPTATYLCFFRPLLPWHNISHSKSCHHSYSYTSETGPQNPGPGPRVAAPMLHTPRHRAIWARTDCCKTTPPACTRRWPGPRRPDLTCDLAYLSTNRHSMYDTREKPELAGKCEYAAQVSPHTHTQ